MTRPPVDSGSVGGTFKTINGLLEYLRSEVNWLMLPSALFTCCHSKIKLGKIAELQDVLIVQLGLGSLGCQLVTNPTSDGVVWPSPLIKSHGTSETCMCYHCLTQLLFGDHLSDVKGQCFGQRCSVKGSLSYYRGGYPQVSVAVGQKVVPSPAVSSAMCRMWVIFKEFRVFAFNTKRRPNPRWASVLIGGESCGKV